MTDPKPLTPEEVDAIEDALRSTAGATRNDSQDRISYTLIATIRSLESKGERLRKMRDEYQLGHCSLTEVFRAPGDLDEPKREGR